MPTCWLPPLVSHSVIELKKFRTQLHARLIFKAKKSDHIKPILQSLHWLPIRARIQYKICTTCFNAITVTLTVTGSGPQYFSELFSIRAHSPENFALPLTHAYTQNSMFGFKSIGDRSFSHIGPSTWNNLPYMIQSPPGIHIEFQSKLKKTPL